MSNDTTTNGDHGLQGPDRLTQEVCSALDRVVGQMRALRRRLAGPGTPPLKEAAELLIRLGKMETHVATHAKKLKRKEQPGEGN